MLLKQAGDTQNLATQQLLVASQAERFPYIVEYCGLHIRVDAGVFSPKYFSGWRVFTEHFPAVAGKRILEIGTATGITALALAQAGADYMLAVDINRQAVANAAANQRRNHIPNVEVRYSDMFSEITPDERFDIIYWNMPFSYVNADYVHQNVLEQSIFDPGYNILDRFLKAAPAFLTPDGYILIGTGSGANIAEFKNRVDTAGLQYELLIKVNAEEVYPVDFQLYKVYDASLEKRQVLDNTKQTV